MERLCINFMGAQRRVELDRVDVRVDRFMSEQARPLHRSEVHDLRTILWLLISPCAPTKILR
jgi:hypothetical protein